MAAANANANASDDESQTLEQIMSTASAPSQVSYPHGHLGYLNKSQEARFAEFKQILEDRGLYKPGPPASHDDPLLL